MDTQEEEKPPISSQSVQTEDMESLHFYCSWVQAQVQ